MTLSLLAHPAGRASAAVSAPSLDVSATVRYGCAVGNDPGFVEVTLSRRQDGTADQPVVQLGLMGPGHANSDGEIDGVVTDNDPTQVTMTSDRLTVRLAGVPRSGDQVVLNRIDQPAAYAEVPVPTTCRHFTKTDFGIVEPDVVVSPSACHGTRASLNVSITNPNPVGSRLHQLGIDQLDYTVLLIRGSNKRLAGEPLTGQMVSFVANGKQTLLAKLVQVASAPDSYEIQVIGPDGAVEVPGDRRLSCDAVDPHPTLTLTPVPPSTPHGSPSSKPSHSKPSHSKSPSASSSAKAQPHPSASSSDAPVVVPPVNNGQPAGTGQSSQSASSTAVQHSSASHRPTARPSSAPPSTPSASKTVAESPRLVSALGLGSGIQRSALLIVALFAVLMTGLVGNTVRNARRR
ncbi:MAG TPA: hypothetical protein VH298_01430 [Jatrophihabitans sp.]|nr:hypothetical protein [Jatrophihabitans sp.]